MSDEVDPDNMTVGTEKSFNPEFDDDDDDGNINAGKGDRRSVYSTASFDPDADDDDDDNFAKRSSTARSEASFNPEGSYCEFLQKGRGTGGKGGCFELFAIFSKKSFFQEEKPSYS